MLSASGCAPGYSSGASGVGSTICTLLCIECAGPRRTLEVEWDVCMECTVVEADTMDIGRERDRDARGGRGGRTGDPYALLCTDTEDDSTECVSSEGDVGRVAFTSDVTSLDELATLAMLWWGFRLTPGRKEGFGGIRSSGERGLGVGYGEVSVEVASSAAQLLSRVALRLAA